MSSTIPHRVIPLRPGPRSEYIFATCRAGSEKPMKEQIASRAGRMLSPSFMRPQLITWKSSRPLDASFMLDSVFARVSGISLGMYDEDDERGIAAQLKQKFPDVAVHLHVFPRITPEDGVDEEVWTQLDERRKNL